MNTTETRVYKGITGQAFFQVDAYLVSLGMEHTGCDVVDGITYEVWENDGATYEVAFHGDVATLVNVTTY